MTGMESLLKPYLSFEICGNIEAMRSGCGCDSTV